MNEERLFILKMLEEGKINAEEAAALLEALEADEAPGDYDESRENGQSRDESARRPEGSAGEDASEKLEKSWGDFSREFAQQIRESVQQAMRGVPHIKDELRENLSEVREEIAHSLKGVREEIKKGPLVDVSGLRYLLANLFGRGPSHVHEEEIKGVWARGVQPEIELLTKNGSVTVIGWDEPHYRVIVRKRAYGLDENEAKRLLQRAVRITCDEQGLQVICQEGDRVGASIEARVPKSYVYSIAAASTNGAVTIEGVEVTQAKATTTNGAVRAKSVKGIQLVVHTTNGRISCNEVQVNDIGARTTNGAITWEGSALQARLTTTNGSIRLAPSLPLTGGPVDGGDETGTITGHYTAQTTNAGIRVKLPADPTLGVRVEGQGMGVDLGADAHRFAIDQEVHDGPSHTLCGQTHGYESAQRRMSFHLKTMNGSIRLESERPSGEEESATSKEKGDA